MARGRTLAEILNQRAPETAAQSGVLAALERADHAGARALVEDLLAIAGIDAVGGRSAGEIADRFLEQAALRSGDPIGPDKQAILEKFLAIAGSPDEAARKLKHLARDARLDLKAAIASFELRNGFIAARGLKIDDFLFSASFVRDFDYYTGFVFEARDAERADARPAIGGGRYDGLAKRLGAAKDVSAVGAAISIDRLPQQGGATMSAAGASAADAPLVIAVPSKGRLQENAAAFFARAGLEFVQSRGARDYRGAVAELPGVEVAFLSASEIVGQLVAGAAHIGVTGEDLVREKAPDADARLTLLAPLGFGRANVVVAAPQAWIDVRTMADLEDVAAAFRAKRGERMRVATKYVNLTRRFFAEHGVADYRIVESLGATEGAPAAGAAELIVDITTTGATLAANALKVLDDGVILRSQAMLVAALSAPWGQAPAPARAPSSPVSPPPKKRAARARCARGCRARPISSSSAPAGNSTPSRRPARTSTRSGRSPCIARAPRRRRWPNGCWPKAPSASPSARSNRSSTPATPFTKRSRRASASRRPWSALGDERPDPMPVGIERDEGEAEVHLGRWLGDSRAPSPPFVVHRLDRRLVA